MNERPEDNEGVYWSTKGEIVRDPRFVPVVGFTGSGVLETAPALAPPLIRDERDDHGGDSGQAAERASRRAAGRVSAGLDKPLKLELEEQE